MTSPLLSRSSAWEKLCGVMVFMPSTFYNEFSVINVTLAVWIGHDLFEWVFVPCGVMQRDQSFGDWLSLSEGVHTLATNLSYATFTRAYCYFISWHSSCHHEVYCLILSGVATNTEAYLLFTCAFLWNAVESACWESQLCLFIVHRTRFYSYQKIRSTCLA